MFRQDRETRQSYTEQEQAITAAETQNYIRPTEKEHHPKNVGRNPSPRTSNAAIRLEAVGAHISFFLSESERHPKIHEPRKAQIQRNCGESDAKSIRGEDFTSSG